MQKMLASLGISNDIVVTRPHSRGGFDPDFVTPAALAVPVVTARVDGRALLAFPYAKGAVLGQYPRDYAGLAGFSLAQKDTVRLPRSTTTQSQAHYKYTIDLRQDSIRTCLEVQLHGFAAFAARNAILSEDCDSLEEFFSYYLAVHDLAHAIDSIRVRNLKERDKPLIVKMGLASSSFVVRRDRKYEVGLAGLLVSHFPALDTSIQSTWENRVETVVRELIILTKPHKKSCTFNLESRVPNNPLFKVACQTMEAEDECTFSRQVLIHKGKWSPSEIKKVVGLVDKLNSIRQGMIEID